MFEKKKQWSIGLLSLFTIMWLMCAKFYARKEREKGTEQMKQTIKKIMVRGIYTELCGSISRVNLGGKYIYVYINVNVR